MSIPGDPTSDLVILHTHLFAYLETFLNFPPLSDGLDHLGKGGAWRCEHEVVGFLARIIEATATE